MRKNKNAAFTPLEIMGYSKRQAKSHKFLTGFTLIELLVVIAIIGLLATIVTVSVNSARTKARDTKRIADLKQMRTALELYYDDNNHYPAGGWFYSCNSSWDTLQTALSKYISTLPKDPVNTSCAGPWNVGYYTYVYGSAGGNKYDLVTALEQNNHPERCGVKKWLYHDWGGEGIWCSGGYGYWDQMYADH